jgi:hypothetical protein
MATEDTEGTPDVKPLFFGVFGVFGGYLDVMSADPTVGNDGSRASNHLAMCVSDSAATSSWE